MGQHALKRWPELLHELQQPVFFQQNGTLIVWHRQDASEAQRFAQLLARTQTQLPSLPALQSLENTALAEKEPALQDRFQNALYLPEEGQLDNRQLLASLLDSLQTQGVSLHWNSAKSPKDFSSGNTGQPDWVFDCRGLGARQEWSALRGVRGEVIRLHAPEVILQRPTRLIHPRYPIYIAPKPDHMFVIGATEIETEELLSAAYTVHSGFAEARILEISTQARPTLNNNLPGIRQIGPRSLQINGLYRHGFLIAPAMLDIVLEWVQSHNTTLAEQFSLKFEHA
jgi:glycine oxidase